MKKMILYCLLVCYISPWGIYAQGYRMDLPKLNTFSPYQVNENEQTFVASWKSLDTSVVRSIIVYVGLERVVDKDGRQSVLTTTIKGDSTLAENEYKPLDMNAYVHDYMTGQGWYMLMGQVSTKGLVLRSAISDPEVFTPLIQSPIFDVSYDGGKFTIKFTATAFAATPDEEVKLAIRHWADRRGMTMEEKVVNLITDGRPHEYAVDFLHGTDNECFNMQTLSTGATVVFSGDIKVEQQLKKGNRIWHTVALTQMNRPKGADFTKVNTRGIKVDTMNVYTSSGAKHVLDYKRHRDNGWRLFYTAIQLIVAEDGVTTRVSPYSDPVYFDEN